MEIVSVDARQVSSLVSKIEPLQKQVRIMKARCEEKKLNRWMDAQEVCLLLNISTRTLQNYRDKGILSYSLVCGKCYYKPADIELLIIKNRK